LNIVHLVELSDENNQEGSILSSSRSSTSPVGPVDSRSLFLRQFMIEQY
jgi:hypothetical protein